jgi:RNA polymerase sigma-70 factor (ECF subfamily)
MAREIWRVTANEPERLIKLAQEGNQEALGQLLELYRHYLSLLARSQLRRQSRWAISVSDAVQETFLKAYARFGQFQGASEHEFVAWLRKILANCVVSLARRRFGRRQAVEGRELPLSELLDRSSDAFDELLAARDITPSSQASRRERAVLFANAVQQLPEHYRQVLLARHLDGLPFAEIAAKMGRTVDSVQKIWVRALNQLKASLEELIDD